MAEQVSQQQHCCAGNVLCFVVQPLTDTFCRENVLRSTGGTPFRRPGGHACQQLPLQPHVLLLLCCRSTACSVCTAQPCVTELCHSVLQFSCIRNAGGPALAERCVGSSGTVVAPAAVPAELAGAAHHCVLGLCLRSSCQQAAKRQQAMQAAEACRQQQQQQRKHYSLRARARQQHLVQRTACTAE